jgi:drug/metabolite transporter (DMT)-like permease
LDKKRISSSITLKKVILLHLLFFFFSSSGILGKYASFEDFLTIKFCILYGAQLFVLFLYSILWQIILRTFPLTFAYMNRAIVTIWGLIWGVLLFGEDISIVKAISSMLIISGIIIMGKENE